MTKLDNTVWLLQLWMLKHWRVVFLFVAGASLLVFILWLWTALVWPLADSQRLRKVVSLKDGSLLTVDYPRHLLVQSDTTPIYLTVNASRPVTVEINLPANLPFVLAAIDPPDAGQFGDSARGALIVSWPGETPVPAIAAPIETGIPALEHDTTVSLRLLNANTERGWPVPLSPFGFSEAWLAIGPGASAGSLLVEVETIDRANWRMFARTYPFLAVAPILLAVFGALGKIYSDRQDEERRLAGLRLEEFKVSMSATPSSPANMDMKRALKKSAKHISQEDWERVDKLVRLTEGDVASIKDTVSPNEFTQWPHAWCGALAAGINKVLNDPYSAETADGRAMISSSTESHSARTSSLDLATKREILRGWVRVFPRDLLSVAAEKQLQDAEKRLKDASESLVILPIDRHQWPLMAQSPDGYEKYRGGLLTIPEMGLFPSSNADESIETCHLFSSATNWFWRDHSLYKEIISHDKDVVVTGETGVGRTALAMALSCFADHNLRVLPAYQVGGVGLAQVQSRLALELLRFTRWRSTWLTALDRQDRSLLARLLLASLDVHYVLARLNAPEPSQFDSAESTEQQSIWTEQALLELRLLRQSVELINRERRIPVDQWFQGLTYCAEKLKFRHVCMAMDMSFSHWIQWSTRPMEEFKKISQANTSAIPIRFVAMVAQGNMTVMPGLMDVESRELSWSESGSNHLWSMSRYRATQRGIADDLLPARLPALRDLCLAAENNPRRLAKLWRKIEMNHPNATSIDLEKVREARRGNL